MLKNRVLVTGGSGFIGTNYIDHLLARGDEVINVDIEAPRDVAQSSLWVDCDINILDDLQSIFDDFKPDYVVHLAAKTDLMGRDLDEYKSNILGVSNVCKILKNVEYVKSVVFASSMLVCKNGYVPETETDYMPDSLYGESKVIGEKIVFEYSEFLPVWWIVRPTSIWGPWFGEPYSNFFNVVKKRLYVHPGNRSCNKTFGFVDNTCNQIDGILHTSFIDKASRVYYLGDSEPVNIAEWADEISLQMVGRVNPKVPYFIFKLAGYAGDVLINLGLKFPMSSFRLKNMTSTNVIDTSSTINLCKYSEISREKGTKKTIDWLNKK